MEGESNYQERREEYKYMNNNNNNNNDNEKVRYQYDLLIYALNFDDGFFHLAAEPTEIQSHRPPQG